MFVIPGWCWANSNAIDKPLTWSFRNITIVVIFDRRANLLQKIQNQMWSREIQNIRFLDVWSRNMFGLLQNTSRTDTNDKLYNLEGLKTCPSIPWYEKCFHNWFLFLLVAWTDPISIVCASALIWWYQPSITLAPTLAYYRTPITPG